MFRSPPCACRNSYVISAKSTGRTDGAHRPLFIASKLGANIMRVALVAILAAISNAAILATGKPVLRPTNSQRRAWSSRLNDNAANSSPPLTANSQRRAWSSRLNDNAANSSAAVSSLRLPVAVSSLAQGKLTTLTIPCSSDADGCLAMCDDHDVCAIVAPVGFLHRLKVAGLFGLWFVLSVAYSITNKRINNALPCPCSIATSTVAVGSLLVSTLWLTGLRTAPRLPLAALRTLVPIGVCHAIGHVAGTVGVSAGSVSFTQVVKAAGPVYACVLSATVLGQTVSRRVWLSLAPIVLGVALATVKELSFSWMALIGAAVSDLAMAFRNVLSKKSMGVLTDVNGDGLRAQDMFGLLTCISTVVALPVALLAEGRALPAQWSIAAAASSGGSTGLAAQIGLAGLLFYSYSEVAMQALSNVHSITHAVGNTLRRVVIMIASMIFFGTPMTPLGAAGSAIAIGGSYLYVMTKHAETRRA